MDTYTKGVLTVIAVALVSISFQLSDTKPIKNAHALLTGTILAVWSGPSIEQRLTILEQEHIILRNFYFQTQHTH